MRANERTDERVAQYCSLYSWLLSTIVPGYVHRWRDDGTESRSRVNSERPFRWVIKVDLKYVSTQVSGMIASIKVTKGGMFLMRLIMCLILASLIEKDRITCA